MLTHANVPDWRSPDYAVPRDLVPEPSLMGMASSELLQFLALQTSAFNDGP